MQNGFLLTLERRYNLRSALVQNGFLLTLERRRSLRSIFNINF